MDEEIRELEHEMIEKQDQKLLQMDENIWELKNELKEYDYKSKVTEGDEKENKQGKESTCSIVND